MATITVTRSGEAGKLKQLAPPAAIAAAARGSGRIGRCSKVCRYALKLHPLTSPLASHDGVAKGIELRHVDAAGRRRSAPPAYSAGPAMSVRRKLPAGASTPWAADDTGTRITGRRGIAEHRSPAACSRCSTCRRWGSTPSFRSRSRARRAASMRTPRTSDPGSPGKRSALPRRSRPPCRSRRPCRSCRPRRCRSYPPSRCACRRRPPQFEKKTANESAPPAPTSADNLTTLAKLFRMLVSPFDNG